jgi:tetratricopeptide (TPR) repeat protein
MSGWLARFSLLLCLLGMLLITGCSRDDSERVYDPASSSPRDVRAAADAYEQALAALPDDLDKAEAYLRKCLSYDLYHGRAHNNLGVLLLNRGDLYEAAHEFAWARKLLPGAPDPRLNLAICLDRGGMHAEAIEAAGAALDVRPEYLPAIKALTLIRVREGMDSDALDAHLALIAARSPDAQWRYWAGQRLLRRGSTSE